jgi:hypothetical protein
MAEYDFPFANFTAGAGAGADFSDVGAIELRSDSSPQSLDIGFDLFATEVDIGDANVLATPYSVLFEWSTTREDDNAGFYVGRCMLGGYCDSVPGDWEAFNTEIIDGAGDDGATYSYEKTFDTPQAVDEYQYGLADVDTNGTITLHTTESGEVSLVVE